MSWRFSPMAACCSAALPGHSSHDRSLYQYETRAAAVLAGGQARRRFLWAQVIRETQGAETPQLLALFGDNISYRAGGQATGLGHGMPKAAAQASVGAVYRPQTALATSSDCVVSWELFGCQCNGRKPNASRTHLHRTSQELLVETTRSEHCVWIPHDF